MPTPVFPTPPVSGAVKAAIGIGTVFFLLCFGVDTILATSSDFSHHYALVARISQLWILPPGVDPSLGEMNIYPRNSHILAAMLGQLVHSPLLGMHLLTLLSMIGAWAGLGALVLTLPRRAALGAVALLTVLLLINRGVRLDIYGVEDIGNFFFAQLVAQTLMIGVLVAALAMERRAVAPLLRHGFVLGSIYLLAGTHLLPAVQLVCVLLALVVLDWLMQGRRTGREWLLSSVLTLAYMLAAVLLLTKHPAYEAMKSLSANDGSLTLRVFTTMPSLAVYCVVIALLSAWLAFGWWRMARVGEGREWLVFKYVGLFGLAASSLCLLQLVLLHLGQGSAYAVKKHAFTLNSLFLVELALLPARFAARPGRVAAAPRALWDAAGAALALPVLMATAFLTVTWHRGSLDTSDAVALEHKLELRRDLVLQSQPGKHVYVVEVPGMPSWMSYLLTIGVFATPRTMNSLDVLADRPLTEGDLIGTFITGADSNLGRMKECLLPGSNSELALVDGVCATKRTARGRQRIGMTIADGQPNCTLEGFGGGEEGGRWTVAPEAILNCPLPVLDSGTPRSLTINANAFLHGDSKQRLMVSLNDGAAKQFMFVSQQPPPVVQLPLPASADGRVKVRLAMPDAATPQALGLSGDGRQLGVIIKSLEFN